jgi:hypothetical protein
VLPSATSLTLFALAPNLNSLPWRCTAIATAGDVTTDRILLVRESELDHSDLGWHSIGDTLLDDPFQSLNS